MAVDSGELPTRAAYNADPILRGARHADFPVEQPTSLEVIVNLKAAERLGLTIPSKVAAQGADRIQ